MIRSILRKFRGVSSPVLVVAVALATGSVTQAGVIPVPNGDFSSAANDGTIGGGLLNPSATAVIGSGPWSGTYSGALGVLAPPTLSITPGAATISGIAGINALGIVDNGGYFSQSLTGQTYAANTTYILTADVDASSLLTAAALQSAGVGIALTSGGTVVSTTSATAPIITLLSGTDYQVQLTYVTGATAPSGTVGIRLFDQPAGVLTASLFPSVTFSNVSLVSVPEPTSLGLLGIGLTSFGWMSLRRRRVALV